MKQHAFPKYEEYSAILEYGSYMDTKFSAMFCQSLLEQIETYAQWSAALPQVQAELLKTRLMLAEMIEHFKMPHLNKEARTALLERAGKVLKNDQNDTETTSGVETAE